MYRSSFANRSTSSLPSLVGIWRWSRKNMMIRLFELRQNITINFTLWIAWLVFLPLA
jgi:hypothetical protein